MVLGDDFYRIEITEDGDIGMTFYFFYQAGLYFSTSIVFMMENTEFRMSAFLVQVELSVVFLVKVYSPLINSSI